MKPERIAKIEHQQEFILPENYPLRLTHGKGCRISCVSGMVLITAYNEAEDFELRAAEVFVVPNNGLTLVEGIGGCYIRIELPCPERHPLFRMFQGNPGLLRMADTDGSTTNYPTAWS
jgi:hypothetical protein